MKAEAHLSQFFMRVADVAPVSVEPMRTASGMLSFRLVSASSSRISSVLMLSASIAWSLSRLYPSRWSLRYLKRFTASFASLLSLMSPGYISAISRTPPPSSSMESNTPSRSFLSVGVNFACSIPATRSRNSAFEIRPSPSRSHNFCSSANELSLPICAPSRSAI